MPKKKTIEAKLTKSQERVVTVLNRLITLVKDDDDFADALSDDLNTLLDDIHSQDGFGTEGQSDPRGDFRDGHWDMWNVEGVDK